VSKIIGWFILELHSSDFVKNKIVGSGWISLKRSNDNSPSHMFWLVRLQSQKVPDMSLQVCHFPLSLEKGAFVINMRSVHLFLYINKLTAKTLASAMDMQYSLFLSNATSYFRNILEAPVPVLNMNVRREKSN